MKPSPFYAGKYKGEKSQLYYFPWDANTDVTNDMNKSLYL